MSTTVISEGFIAVLVNPIPADQMEEVSEKLSSTTGGSMQISYDGELLQSDSYAKEPYSKREFCGDLFIVGSVGGDGGKNFTMAASALGFPVDQSTVQPYTCIWYNGSDSPVSCLTKEEFLSRV